MKTAAERQQRSRARKRASGQCRQINMWISVEAHRSLKLLARQQSIKLAAALNLLLMNACPSVPAEQAEANHDSCSTAKVRFDAADKALLIKGASPTDTPSVQAAAVSVAKSSTKQDQRHIQESLF